MSSYHGKPCNVVFVDAAGKTRRCYARAQERYAGRCRDHEDASAQPRGPRCGYRGRTLNTLACSALVQREGDRCARHAKQGLADATARLRVDLEDRVAHFVKQRDRYEAKITALRAELAALGPAEREAAE